MARIWYAECIKMTNTTLFFRRELIF